MTLRRRICVTALVAAAAVLGSPGPATAAEAGRIVQVREVDGQLTITFQADGLPDGIRLDPASVRVQVNGKRLRAKARALAGDASVVQRIAVLAIDNSRSMAGPRLEAAKQAADTFLLGLPDDVEVGLVTFAAAAETQIEPTDDRDAVRTAIDQLRISATTGTALFDGASLATQVSGDLGARSVLMLTDGNESGSSVATLEEAVADATDAGVALDAVYINANATQPPALVDLVNEAGGQVVPAGTADLVEVFRRAAEAISNQLLITASLPSSIRGAANVVVDSRAGATQLSDSAFTTIGSPGGQSAEYGPRPVDKAAPLVPRSTLPWVLASIFFALLVVLYIALSAGSRDEKHGRLRRRLSIYTLSGRRPVRQEETTTALGSSHIARSAVELAGKVVRERDFETILELRLEAAGVPLRGAEWMLVHIGVAIGLAILALLVSGGEILPTVLGLLLGLGLPWAYLSIKKARRTALFLAQLPDTLQLVAGSLSAGYSMPQAMDTVVREGQQPITAEFNRALVEARLGVPLEDAMEGIAERMHSKDFSWVVMAIRIQREVGGNLAELLTTVAGTLRERERLRRQVRVLSAEGRLSAWILGGLPPVFATYLVLVQPEYLRPLVTELLGWLLLGTGITLLVVGALWMSKAVKVEV